MFKSLKSIIFGAGLIAGATAASAGGLPPEVLDDVMRTCRPDYHRVCSEVLPGDGRVGRCLMDHERELAPQCLKAIKLAYAIEACMPDYRRFCSGEPPAGGRIVECLASRMEALAPECARVVSANAPYASPRRERYSYYQGPYNGPAYNGPAYNGPAYNGPAYNGPAYGNPYADESYRRERPYDDRYADRSAGGGYDRYQPFGDGRYPEPYGDGRQDRGYDDPAPGEEREPLK